MYLSLAMFRPGLNNLRQLSFLPAAAGFQQSKSFSVHSKDDYTHIIVGAGSAGCVLANRLSAQPNNKVLLLEAGPKDNTWKVQMPAAVYICMGGTTYNWYYHTAPQRHMNNREMFWPRGKVLGGSSSINAMVYIRGHPEDYDRWEREGAEGWSFADCLPYFKRSQCHEQGGNEYRGGSGPLLVSASKQKNPLFDAFIKAGKEAGYPHSYDMNGYQQEGVGRLDQTIHKGRRWNSSNAYLKSGDVRKRKNLTILSKSLCDRVLFEGTKATGIEFTCKKVKKFARASQEVILSGGAINSPQLLMLSGVGNADDLKALGIPVVAHLPGVGQNLQDHLQAYCQYTCTKPVSLYKAQWKFPLTMISIGLEWFMFHTGWASSSHFEAAAFIRSRAGVKHPDIQMHFVPCIVKNHGRIPGKSHGFQVHVNTLRETSSGSIKLKSRDPREHPIIDPNYLDTEMDRWDMRESIRLTREIIAQKAFDEFRGEEVSPGPAVRTDAELDAFIRANAETIYHPVSTCKMGSEDDPMAVCDSQTRVFGVQNLRVVDASIMPSLMSGNTNAPTMMIAERAADMILGNKMLDKIYAPVWKPASLETQRDGTPKVKVSA
eukprot:XP_796478.2 PREDICTED: choline dehydrogenase, mitochondrial-like [Strongylocentrotus purpuratus]